MDQAGWHKTSELKVPDNIEILYLPAYSPELNPVERLWEYIKDNVLKNKVYDDIEALKDSVCDFLNSITASVITSLCNCTYLPN
jgi:transposase